MLTPNAESCDAPQPAFKGQAKASGVPAVSPIPNLRLLAGRNVGHSAKVSPTSKKCTPSISEKSDATKHDATRRNTTRGERRDATKRDARRTGMNGENFADCRRTVLKGGESCEGQRSGLFGSSKMDGETRSSTRMYQGWLAHSLKKHPQQNCGLFGAGL